MSWRHVRTLTLILLGVLIAAPLSLGDKSLWLSLTALLLSLFEAPEHRLPIEHSTVLPDKITWIVPAARAERADPTVGPGPSSGSWPAEFRADWTGRGSTPERPTDTSFGIHPAPRAPPA